MFTMDSMDMKRLSIRQPREGPRGWPELAAANLAQPREVPERSLPSNLANLAQKVGSDAPDLALEMCW